jgi:branched-chain amino acid transport system ATP-binding protein
VSVPRGPDAVPAAGRIPREARLEVDGLQAEYRDTPVLWQVSLRVLPGQVTALVGANGAGKTTLLKLLSGLRDGFLKVTRGTMRFGGQDLAALAPAQIVRRGIAHVPEGRHLFPGLTVLENLRLGGYLGGSRRQTAEAIEAVFGLLPVLRERRRQLAGTMSGGEQQMLAIGRALVQRPALLMLDEPSVGLAPRMVAAVFDLVARIRARGTSVLLVEQNVRQALGLADHGYVLENGRIVLAAPGAELVEHPTVRRAYLGL